MNPIEKQERVQHLWRKLRSSLRFIKFMRNPEDAETLGGVFIGDQSYFYQKRHWRDQHLMSSQDKWYIVRTSNYLPQTWNLLINFLSIYAIFATPIAIVFNDKMSKGFANFELLIDVCFFIDLVLNFFKMPSE